MSTKLNSITLSDNITNKMKKLLKDTKNHRLEYGFDICRKNNDLKMRNECNGTLCSIELPKGCDTDEKLIGDYHTHPRGKSVMSDSDMHVACRLDFSCIGSSFSGNDRILCFIRKPGTNSSDCKRDALSMLDTEEKFLSNFNKISDKYFTKIDLSTAEIDRT